jgi:lipopolysaccharide transport system permease protein
MHESQTVAAGKMNDTTWKEVIRSRQSFFSLNLPEIWAYRDLMLMLVRRDFLAIYKQTILGPLWFFIHPAIATMVYMMVFSRAAGMSTGDLPPVVFYLSGLVLWGYFSECVLRTSNSFRDSAPLLSKVYFPRLIIPFSIVFTNLIKLGIQLLLLCCVILYYVFIRKDAGIKVGMGLFWVPFCIVIIGILGLGAGLIVASVTTKYKDLSHLVSFVVQLMMFASPVILDSSKPISGLLGLLVQFNPVSGIIDLFRFAVTGHGVVNPGLITYDTVFALCLLALGLLIFNKVQRNFIDVI